MPLTSFKNKALLNCIIKKRWQTQFFEGINKLKMFKMINIPIIDVY